MSLETIIYLVILLVLLIGSFIFFIIMDLKNHKKQKYDKVKNKTKNISKPKVHSDERIK